jgi:hypothetical protein
MWKRGTALGVVGGGGGVYVWLVVAVMWSTESSQLFNVTEEMYIETCMETGFMQTGG